MVSREDFLTSKNPAWQSYIDFAAMGGADLVVNQPCVLIVEASYSGGLIPVGTQGIYRESPFKIDGRIIIYAFEYPHDSNKHPIMVTVNGVREPVGKFLKGL